ncbi:MAG: carbohydrate-binding family V/XII [Colwellia sp.]
MRNDTLKYRLNKYLLIMLAYMFYCMSFSSYADEWPQEIISNKGTIIIYQPQPEKLSGNILTGRAAMQLELNDTDEPVFGVFWFSTTIETDRSSNLVTLSAVEVIKVRWPDSAEKDELAFTQFVSKELEHTSFTSSLSKLSATLSNEEKVKQSLALIKNDPPAIVFKNKLSVLLSYDGEPIFKNIENSEYQRAINTQFAVMKEKSRDKYFLTSGELWYQASNALGPWIITNYPPLELKKIIDKDLEGDSTPIDTNNPVANTPVIVTATKATELIVSEGEPKWSSLAGGQLLYVENTETPWLRELTTGDMYLLLSGRWFKSKNQRGPWTFVRADTLPKSFQDIPPDSAIGGLRSSVAGTDEANEAVLDASVPQTTAIKRNEASLTVQYDGEPLFEQIEGTSVEYAVNTAAQVLRIKGQYYAVDNAVWFVAPTATGKWIVADMIPSEAIDQIPPSSPVYNTTYVKVYSSTPEVVYVGYTPGYMGAYTYYGVPIYGTGWYYPPYYRGWYYPRPPTWGLHVGYNPWTGWRVGVSWGGPFFRVGVVWGGGYHHYRRPCCYSGVHYRRGHNNINVNVNRNINIGNSVSIGNNKTIRNNLSRNKDLQLNKKNLASKNIDRQNLSTNNLYKNAQNKARNAPVRPNKQLKNKQGRVASKRTNNVFADRQGNVVRHQNGAWQKRSNKSWNNINTKPNSTLQNHSRQRPQQPAFNQQQLNKSKHARSMGNRSPVTNRRGGRK